MAKNFLFLLTLTSSLLFAFDMPAMSKEDKAWTRGFLTSVNTEFDKASKLSTNDLQTEAFMKSVNSIMKETLLPRFAELVSELKTIDANPKPTKKTSRRRNEVVGQLEKLADVSKKYLSFSWKSKEKLQQLDKNDKPLSDVEYYTTNLDRYGFTVAGKIDQAVFNARFEKIKKEIKGQLEEKYQGVFIKFYTAKSDDLANALRYLR